MTRTLRAFAWMRWRVFMNSLERTSARDAVERLSLTVEQIGPLVAIGLLVPSAAMLAALSGYAGYWLAAGAPTVRTLDLVAAILFVVFGLCAVGPIMMPSGNGRSAVRLLLLPVSRSTLYAAQAAGTLADPWLLMSLPALVALPLGLLAGGGVGAALLTVAASLALVLVLTGLSTAMTVILQLVLQDRRRGELVGLALIILVPLLFLVPAMLEPARSAERRRPDAEVGRTAPDRERSWRLPLGASLNPMRTMEAVVPPLIYRRAVRNAAAADGRGAAVAIGTLLGGALLLHGIALATFGRLMRSGAGSSGSRAGTRAAAVRILSIPGLSRSAAAIAGAHLRLVLRTPRGRSILIGPLLVFAMFGVLMWRAGGQTELGFVQVSGGLGLATFGSAMVLLGLTPFSMNQFAIDGPGLTLQLLAPLRTADLLIGKAIANGLVVLGPAVLCILASRLVFPGGSAAQWLSIPLALAATAALLAPAAAVLSAIFPRTADLNSVSRGSNAHSMAGLLGALATAVAAAPTILIWLGVSSLSIRPALLPLLQAAWCVVALTVTWLLLPLVAKVFDNRRETLVRI